MAERIFQQEFTRGAEHAGFHPVPIPDPGKSDRFGVKKVYDLGLLRDGTYAAVELKEVAGKNYSWRLAHLQPHQEANLAHAMSKGGLGLVVVNFAIRLSARNAKRWGCETIQRAFGTTLTRIRNCRTVDCLSTLDLDWWIEFAVELPAIHGLKTDEGNPLRAWDPSPLFDKFCPSK